MLAFLDKLSSDHQINQGVVTQAFMDKFRPKQRMTVRNKSSYHMWASHRCVRLFNVTARNSELLLFGPWWPLRFVELTAFISGWENLAGRLLLLLRSPAGRSLVLAWLIWSAVGVPTIPRRAFDDPPTAGPPTCIALGGWHCCRASFWTVPGCDAADPMYWCNQLVVYADSWRESSGSRLMIVSRTFETAWVSPISTSLLSKVLPCSWASTSDPGSSGGPAIAWGAQASVWSSISVSSGSLLRSNNCFFIGPILKLPSSDALLETGTPQYCSSDVLTIL